MCPALDGNETFSVSAVSVERRESDCGVVVIEYGGLGRAVYSRGAQLETMLGRTVERQTARLEAIKVEGDPRRGIGTKIFSKAIEQARRDDFKYMRMHVPSPIVVKMVERALQEDRIKGRAYQEHAPDDMLDLPSTFIMSHQDGVTPERAMRAAGEALGVTCVVEL